VVLFRPDADRLPLLAPMVAAAVVQDLAAISTARQHGRHCPGLIIIDEFSAVAPRHVGATAENAGHSVATLARHYAGALDALEDQPRVPAGEASHQAREALECARSVRDAQTAEARYQLLTP
jgi:hypothetical protein